jgi:glycosyltransferase involved in cell wall biosynthesis
MSRPATSTPEVCLLVEGTYPYVAGGVSTWVHQIITALPDLSFSVFFIGSEKSPTAKYKYQLPANVTRVDEIYLHDPAAAPPRGQARGEDAAAVHQAVRQLLSHAPDDPTAAGALDDLSTKVACLAHRVSFDNFWRATGTWQLIQEIYHQHAEDGSFLDFYWSLRSLVEPVWRLMSSLLEVPPARVYHSLCTGYAGFVGGLAARHHNATFLLSEHGIYVRERIADLQKARWIHDPPILRPGLLQRPTLLRRVWTAFFELLGRFAYQSARRITTLFVRNAGFQIELGAPPDKLEIIPNGVHPADFDQLRARRDALIAQNPEREVVGFLGRVVSIKDVKTLLRAARLTVDQRPAAQFLIAGPLDEEPAYAAACQELSRSLGLENHVQFLGPQQRDDLLPAIDIMLLTSYSEGLPFVILEAFAAAIPCVSTDVGSCRELIEGRANEQPPLGPAGLVAPTGKAELIASALIRLLRDRPLATRMGEAGCTRATTHYARDGVVQRYRELYCGEGAGS